MLSFLRDWTSVIHYRNKLSRDILTLYRREVIVTVYLKEHYWEHSSFRFNMNIRRPRLYVSWKLPTYTSPTPTLTLMSHLGQNVDLGQG